MDSRYDYLKEINLLKIENLKQYLVTQPHYHPSTKQYKQFKINQIEKCIYGVFGKETNGFRWMTPQGYFYANYVKIAQETADKEEVTKKARFDDIEWMFFYMVAEAYGFSGFSLDDEYTCDRAMIDEYEMLLAKEDKRRWKNLNNENGLKKYIPAQEYLYKLHPKDMGKPLWHNEAKDMIMMGSRSSGKSFLTVGLSLWFMVFDGTKSISKDWIDMKITANVIMGAAEAIASDEFNKRLEIAMNCLLLDEDLGVYHPKGYEPIPLLGRHMLGKPHEYWRYRFQNNGIESGGTGSSFRTVSYSINKKSGATAAASVRVNLSIVEECGKMSVSPIQIWGSNRALLRRNTKYGSALFLGTSGAIELVQESKRMFENTRDFGMVSFKNVYTNDANKGDIGFFIPAFLIKRDFKDEDGNTNVKAAVEYFIQQRAKCNTHEVLVEEKMNFPLEVADMWEQKSKSIFSQAQIKKRYQQLLLLKNQGKEESFRKFVRLSWNNNKVEVQFVPPKEAITIDSFFESQGSNAVKSKKKDIDTDIIIYEEPELNIPDDMYWFSFDTYVADEKDEGESLGSIYCMKNPKYILGGKTGNIIVAELTGKSDSRDMFLEKLELLMAYYGNCKRSLMFEANRGKDKIVEFFTKKKKENLLSFAPGNYEGTWKQKVSIKYGYILGSGENKREMLTRFAEWLQEATTLNIDGIKLNVERICSLGLLSELMHYDYDDDKGKKANYDRIMSMIGIMVAMRNNFNQFEEKALKKEDDNIYTVFKNRKMKTKYKLKNKTWTIS
jgi:hypothetical protein